MVEISVIELFSLLIGSKKGRYTHQMRTQYTKEIKGEKATKPAPKPAAKTKSQSSPSVSSFEANEEKELQKKLDFIVAEAKECFPEMRVYMTKKAGIDERIAKMIAEHCPNCIPSYHIYSPGPEGKTLDGFLPFVHFSEMLSAAIEDYKKPDRIPGEGPSVNILWSSWMNVAEVLFIELTKFAKSYPGFKDLCMDDQIVLLKGARIEVCTFIA